MNINFQAITGQKRDEGIDIFGMDTKNALNASKAGKSGSVGAESVNVQLDASIYSNDAYACHAKNLSDISEMADNTDVLTQHNYMALLSNTMSEEDFAKASQDGFDIKNMDSAETVTILDKIKSVLLESGKEIVGFNDDLSLDKLAKLTGSISFAKELQKSFHENDIPVTYENAKDASIAYNQVSDIQGLDDAAVKYLVNNNLRPSIENIYFASHSTNGQNRSGRGFYAQDAGGYYAKKAENYNWEKLDGQIDKIIDEAGFDKGDDKVREEARWTIQQGIPLTADTLNGVHSLRSIYFPISEKLGAQAVAAAIADGKKAVMADLSDPRSDYTKAADLKAATEQITDDEIRTNIQSGKENTLKNLVNEIILNGTNPERVSQCTIEEQNPRFVQARLQLEEVRLRMTIDANKQLLSSGFSIDTAPMEQLIERLKEYLGQISDEVAGAALDEISEVTPQNRNYIITASISRVTAIKEGPIGITGEMIGEFESATLSHISDVSKRMAMRYAKAGEGYEQMMTAPRADLGDSIKKAFRNVDDILEDMGQELNEGNRRAIRILGYNSMEMSLENFEKVRAYDQSLKTTLDRLKPGAVIEFIREGKNPLGMTIDELAQSLDRQMSGDEENSGKGGTKSDEKYAKFLFKLEHHKEITDKERASFIGIYRLFHTLKKNDYQAIGSVLKTGSEMTLGNLLTATRTKAVSRRGLEYTVDDDFGGLEVSGRTSGLKIDEQISLAFKYYSAQADIIYENLEPEKLAKAAPDEKTLLPKLAEDLQEAGVDEELEKEYASQVIRQIRETAQVRDSDNAFEELKGLHMEVNFGNLEAMISNRRERKTGNIWTKAEDLAGELATRETNKLVDALGEPDYEETYKNSLRNITESLEQLLMSDDDSYIDVKAINLMQRRMTVMSQSSERGTFDVPVTIDGQKISMHITLKSDDSMGSRMEASVQTYEYGLITASLSEKDGMISGMLTTTYSQSSEETEYLESVRSKMCVKLAEKLKDFGVGQETIAILYHAQTQPISVGTANANATDGNSKKTTDTSVLLSMAKAFIESL